MNTTTLIGTKQCIIKFFMGIKSYANDRLRLDIDYLISKINIVKGSDQEIQHTINNTKYIIQFNHNSEITIIRKDKKYNMQLLSQDQLQKLYKTKFDAVLTQTKHDPFVGLDKYNTMINPSLKEQTPGLKQQVKQHTNNLRNKLDNDEQPYIEQLFQQFAKIDQVHKRYSDKFKQQLQLLQNYQQLPPAQSNINDIYDQINKPVQLIDAGSLKQKYDKIKDIHSNNLQPVANLVQQTHQKIIDGLTAKEKYGKQILQNKVLLDILQTLQSINKRLVTLQNNDKPIMVHTAPLKKLQV